MAQQLVLVRMQFAMHWRIGGSIRQVALGEQGLFQARDDLGVHAAMVVAGNFGDARTHAFRQAHDELVGSPAGAGGGALFHGLSMTDLSGYADRYINVATV
ncbi:hypothetical protein D3C78_1564670 [compost metagenome]